MMGYRALLMMMLSIVLCVIETGKARKMWGVDLSKEKEKRDEENAASMDYIKEVENIMKDLEKGGSNELFDEMTQQFPSMKEKIEEYRENPQKFADELAKSMEMFEDFFKLLDPSEQQEILDSTIDAFDPDKNIELERFLRTTMAQAEQTLAKMGVEPEKIAAELKKIFTDPEQIEDMRKMVLEDEDIMKSLEELDTLMPGSSDIVKDKEKWREQFETMASLFFQDGLAHLPDENEKKDDLLEVEIDATM